MKRSKYILILMLLTIFLVACGEKELNGKENSVSSSDSSSSFTEKEKKETDILKNGYRVGEYLFKLMPMQKEDEAAKRSILSNIDMNVKYNFEETREEINNKQKISLLTSYVEYDDKNEKLNVNYFLVNNSDETIKSITLKGQTEFKNIPKQSFNFQFSKEQFGTLDKNEFIYFSVSYKMPISYVDDLKKMNRFDLKIDIQTFKVNGVEIDNNKE